MHTRQLQRRDIPSITNISYHAWLDDELNEYVWPHRRQYPDDYHFERLFSARQKLVSPGFVGTVVVADAQDVAPSGPYEGEVMGYSWFERLPHGDCYDAKNTPMSATLDRPVAEAQRLHDLALNTGPIATLERYSLMIEKRYNELANLNSRAADPHNRAQLFAYFAADKALARLPSHWHVRLLGCHPRYEGRGVVSLVNVPRNIRSAKCIDKFDLGVVPDGVWQATGSTQWCSLVINEC